MICRRCRGLLVQNTFGEWNAETNSLNMATRCISCGCIEDAVVRANRLQSVGITRGILRRKHASQAPVSMR
jgi:hypothetical protein